MSLSYIQGIQGQWQKPFPKKPFIKLRDILHSAHLKSETSPILEALDALSVRFTELENPSSKTKHSALSRALRL